MVGREVERSGMGCLVAGKAYICLGNANIEVQMRNVLKGSDVFVEDGSSLSLTEVVLTNEHTP